MRFPEIGDRPKVRGIAGRQDAERDVFDEPPLDLPGRKDADTLGVPQHLGQHTG
jgi:hypothetical protein